MRPASWADFVGNGVCARDRSVELRLALGKVAAGARRVVGLGARDVVVAGDPVDVVVAGPARGPGRVAVPDIRLGNDLPGWIGRHVARGAVADVLWVGHGREVGSPPAADDHVRVAGLHAGKVLAHVNLVDHHLHVDGVAGVGVDRLRVVVAEHAHPRVLPAGLAVRRERVVALVAGRKRGRVPLVGHRLAVGAEVVRDVDRIDLVDLDRVGERDRPGAVDPQRVGLGHVVSAREHSAKRVGALADRGVCPLAVRVGRGLCGAFPRDRARLDPGRVVDEVDVDRVVPGEDERERDRPRGLHAEPVERLAEVVGDGDLHHRLTVRADRHALDGDVKPWPDVGKLLSGQVMLRLRRRVHLRRADHLQVTDRGVVHRVRRDNQVRRRHECETTLE